MIVKGATVYNKRFKYPLIIQLVKLLSINNFSNQHKMKFLNLQQDTEAKHDRLSLWGAANQNKGGLFQAGWTEMLHLVPE